MNPLAAQEMVSTSVLVVSAEYPLGGAVVNLIPKDGGNTFAASLFGAGTNHTMQADNLDDDLRRRGSPPSTASAKSTTRTGHYAGRSCQNKLFFMTAERFWGRRSRVANLYRDADLSDYLFTPDLSRPGDAGEDAGRLAAG